MFSPNCESGFIVPQNFVFPNMSDLLSTSLLSLSAFYPPVSIYFISASNSHRVARVSKKARIQVLIEKNQRATSSNFGLWVMFGEA